MTAAEILELLKQVKYPGLDRDIVSFGMVKAINPDGDTLHVQIEVSADDQKIISAIQGEVQALLQKAAMPFHHLDLQMLKKTATAVRGPQSETIELPEVKAVVAVASGKGGVGKSTLSTNLAVALSAEGLQVGLMDADVYGPSLPTMLGLKGQPAMTEGQQRLVPLDFHGVRVMSMGFLSGQDTPVIWRGPMVSKLIKQFLGGVAWGALDYLIIDLPPGTGDIQLTLVQSVRLTGAVIITTPQLVAASIALKGLRMFGEVNVPILGVVENMSGEVFSRGGGRHLSERWGVPFLGEVPLDPAVVAAGDAGIPVVMREPEAPAALAYVAVARRLLEETRAVMKEDKTASLTPTKVEPSASQLLIHWSDGHQSLYESRALRAACPCAACVDEGSGKRIVTIEQIPTSIRLEHEAPVGRYALRFRWSDGHTTGIYTFSYLRSRCACDVCGRQRSTVRE